MRISILVRVVLWASVALAVVPVDGLAQASVACNAGDAREGSLAFRLHPDNVESRYGEIIVARRWMDVLRLVQVDIDTTFRALDRVAPSRQFSSLSAAFREALTAVLDRMGPILDSSLARRAELLHSRDFLQFEPFPAQGFWRILQTDARPRGFVVSEDSLKTDEYEAICWGGRSVSRLLGGVNYETVPDAMALISEMTREWERYRANGPTQLIHELVLNRILRQWTASGGEARFHPSRLDFVALHPFAGIELRQGGGRVTEDESMAVETLGFTYWFNGWRQHVGASWVLAYNGAGSIGRGPVVRVAGVGTAGLLWRRDDTGTKRKSLLLTVDLLGVLKSDATFQAARQTRALVGKLLDNPLGSRQ